MSKERAEALVDAGVFLQLAGDLSGARDLFNRAMKLDPGNARAEHLYVSAGGTRPVAPPDPPPPRPRVVQSVTGEQVSLLQTIPPAKVAQLKPGAPVPRRPRPASRPSPRPQPSPAEAARNLDEVEVFIRYGLYDKALDCVMRVLRADPANVAGHEQAYAILLASGQKAAALTQLLNVLRLHLASGDAERARPFVEQLKSSQPDHPELPAFLALVEPPRAAPQARTVVLSDTTEGTVLLADASQYFNLAPEKPEETPPPQPKPRRRRP